MSGEEYRKYALVTWLDDDGQPWGLVNLKSDKVLPEKDINRYEIGEEINAKCRGFNGMHRCRIEETSADRSILNEVISGHRAPRSGTRVNAVTIKSTSVNVMNVSEKAVIGAATVTNEALQVDVDALENVYLVKKRKLVAAAVRTVATQSPKSRKLLSLGSPKRKLVAAAVRTVATQSPKSRKLPSLGSPKRTVEDAVHTMTPQSPKPRKSPRTVEDAVHTMTPQSPKPRKSPRQSADNPDATFVRRQLKLGEDSTKTPSKSKERQSDGNERSEADLVANNKSSMRSQESLARDLLELRDEVRRLKKRVRDIEKSAEKNGSSTTKVQSTKYNGHTKDELRSMIAMEKNQFRAAKRLLLTLFTTEELCSRSISGKAPNRLTPAKPRLSEDLLLVYKDLMRGNFQALSDKELVEKVHHVQKGLKKTALL